MIPIIQILSVIFGIFMIYVVQIHRRKQIIEAKEAYFWFFVWLGFIYVAIFPQTFKGLVQKLQIARVFDLLVIVAFMILTFLTFQNRISIKNITRKIEEIIRKKALYGKNKLSKN